MSDLENGETVCVVVYVRGRVQGVGYRYFARQVAEQLSLAGLVRNLADGRVHVEACGPRPALEQFVQRLSYGPRGAQVEHVEVEWGSVQLPDCRRFQVLG